jgi:hypothetical protein
MCGQIKSRQFTGSISAQRIAAESFMQEKNTGRGKWLPWVNGLLRGWFKGFCLG